MAYIPINEKIEHFGRQVLAIQINDDEKSKEQAESWKDSDEKGHEIWFGGTVDVFSYDPTKKEFIRESVFFIDK